MSHGDHPEQIFEKAGKTLKRNGGDDGARTRDLRRNRPEFVDRLWSRHFNDLQAYVIPRCGSQQRAASAGSCTRTIGVRIWVGRSRPSSCGSGRRVASNPIRMVNNITGTEAFGLPGQKMARSPVTPRY